MAHSSARATSARYLPFHPQTLSNINVSRIAGTSDHPKTPRIARSHTLSFAEEQRSIQGAIAACLAGFDAVERLQSRSASHGHLWQKCSGVLHSVLLGLPDSAAGARALLERRSTSWRDFESFYNSFN